MSRQVSAVEINKFNAGLITDASPLTSPENSSLEENNMVLNIDGSRNRRLGLDLEEDFSEITTSVVNADVVSVAISNYRWDNAGGNSEKSLLVVQFGTEIKVFDLDTSPISDNLIFTYNFPLASTTQSFSYTVVDGILVVVTGLKDVYSFEFEAPSTITVTTNRLMVRDFFGVEDEYEGVDITRGTDVQNRPSLFLDKHLYNLRNQSWGIPRLRGNQETVVDPVLAFIVNAGVYPSNADTVTAALYPDAADADNRTTDRFFFDDLFRNPPGTTRAPMGFFVIDALDRGASRIENEYNNRVRYPELVYSVESLPVDSTPGGATAIAEFAGRVFYAGFPGEVEGGDEKSPRMSSYVLFSQIVDNVNDINLCYQQGDPTSSGSPDIVDTDGGFIRINEAYGIKKLINLGSSLMVVASNGIWRIVGGTDNGFTATSYIVEKITDRGCLSQDSIAVIDNSFMFWGNDGIYHVTTDQFGGWVANNISFGRIQRLFDSISSEDKRTAQGAYDTYERKVRWLYYNRTTDFTLTNELVLDLQLQAYYLNTIGQFDGTNLPRVVGIYSSLPYTVIQEDIDVLVDVDQVFVGDESVTLSTDSISGSSIRELGYVVATQLDPVVKYSFATYRNTDFRDWFSIDGVGIDAEAYVVTSYISGNDFQRDKQVPYITVHLRRTENGFEDADEVIPINQSSCIMQARWDWSNSNSSGKWGREFQAYRYRRLYIPVDVADDYDNGFSTIVTRNKLRGNGKVVSLKFRTEPYRNLHLYGWSMVFSVAENV